LFPESRDTTMSTSEKDRRVAKRLQVGTAITMAFLGFLSFLAWTYCLSADKNTPAYHNAAAMLFLAVVFFAVAVISVIAATRKGE
jgi:membrane protein YdbS with pleckstrin-like domain